ncbi:mitochondrial ribosomal protein subunit L20-domain-containing protein [Suillus clintonianus]|uniref:mitochondrial ribosomal protein subunit L20-domain-containing protein n=1 Tax=Suillus clintonianus TaxID=1904413 RepID=UPI001B874224|nr:mitochondrial ribosomal protein subunit L20-domain-containing protein [Suillus clintonianus]KAG2151369.1 mitochondrial ribosomal protein subunit L20-domain-containing protein [Suillus clintonianus]
MLKPRLSLWLTRSYATRIAEKPPARFPDPLLNQPNTFVKTLKDENLTFIHRPPPTAPSPYSTTLAPASPLLKSPTSFNKNAPMPPLLRPSAYKVAPSRMSDKDMEQLRKLRLSNPEKYSRAKLAKLFKCTPNFVSKVAALPRAQRKEFSRKMEAEHETIREQWGEKKATFVAIKQKRREFW